MSNDTGLVIKVPPQSSYAHVTLVQEDGTERQKDVSVEDLVNHLAQNYQFSTGILPRGTRVYKGTASRYTIAIETDAKIRTLRYPAENGRRVGSAQIPFPICLFIFHVQNKIIQRVYLYSLQASIQTLDDGLCFFPFGNVYGEGDICWGSALLPQINSPMEIVGVINSFFDSQYNGDLFNPSYFLNSHEEKIEVDSFWSCIEYFNGKQEFPSEILVNCNKTFRRAIR